MRQFPIYTTRGEWVALLLETGLIYNPQGDWIGWVDRSGQVYSTLGEYVGWLAKDFRVLRKREPPEPRPRQPIPPHDKKIQVPRSVPLPPLMSDLMYDTIDVFEDMPERLEPMDYDKVADID